MLLSTTCNPKARLLVSMSLQTDWKYLPVLRMFTNIRETGNFLSDTQSFVGEGDHENVSDYLSSVSFWETDLRNFTKMRVKALYKNGHKLKTWNLICILLDKDSSRDCRSFWCWLQFWSIKFFLPQMVPLWLFLILVHVIIWFLLHINEKYV